MIGDASLSIALVRKNARLRPAIASTRAPVPPALVVGRSPAAVADLLRRLHGLCSLAHGSAAAAACEQAMGAAADPACAAKRAFLVAAERAREHLLELVVGTADTLGETPEPRDLAQLRGLATGLQRAAGEAAPQTWRDDAAAICEQVRALAARTVFDPGGDAGCEDFLAWASEGSSAPARLCRLVIDGGLAGLGAASDDHSPAPDPEAVGRRLLAADGAAFARRPVWDGSPRETTSFTRRRAELLVDALVARFSDGLLARLAARQIDLARIAEELPLLAAAVDDPAPAFAPACGSRQDGEGVATAETARGRLIHAVRLARGAVAEYRILAPTEWNFHPEGPVARRLAALDSSEPAEIDRRARLVIGVFDPCVPYTLTVQ